VRVTAPRRILPGELHFLTRRCSERRFFLRPSKETSQIFSYVLAVAAARHGILVHVACVMSNHYHLIVTDPRAELPAFMQYLDSLVARATNSCIGHWEGFWSSEASYSEVTPAAPEDVVRKAAYVLANPVSAGLVQHGDEWPGFRTPPGLLGDGRLTVQRPKEFFRASGDMPETVELMLVPPAGYRSAQEFRSAVERATRDLEAQRRREFQAAQRGFLGRARVLAQKPHARPTPGEPRRNLNPRIAGGDTRERVLAHAELREFLRHYRDALLARRAGEKSVLFPAGTYKLRIEHGVRCAAIA
jgi:REP element-mobilizing transposase RayT